MQLERRSDWLKLVGLAFAVQEIDEIPSAPHDVPLDAVVTEKGVTTFGPAETAR